MPSPTKRRSPSERLYDEVLEANGGSLSKVPSGTVYAAGVAGRWDMAKEWRGSELTRYEVIASRWSKDTLVRFLGTGGRPSFTLHIAAGHTDKEVAQMAETYRLVLNMRRVE